MAELDPIINDEQALSYAEGMTNWVKGLRYLEAVVRFVRNSRKEIPALKNEIATLTVQRDAVKAEKFEAERTASEKKSSLKREMDELASAQSAKADQVRQLTKEVLALALSKQAMANDVEQSRLLLSDTQKSIGKLTKEESDLSARVVALKQEMDRIEKTLPSLLKR